MENIFLKPEVQKFIKENINKNPSEIALKYKEVEGIPIQEVLKQIQGRQKAKQKLPSLVADERILFPPSLNLEQSSSEATAQYKTTIIEGKSIIDLTGGFGIDTMSFAQKFETVYYIERNKELFDIVNTNLQTLKIANVKTFNRQAEEFLKSSPQVDCIYIDPARRDNANKKVFSLEDCEPNVLELLSKLFSITDQVLIKTSPLLDIKLAIKELQYVFEVHVIAISNECKEVLYLLKKFKNTNLRIKTVNLIPEGAVHFDFALEDESSTIPTLSSPLKYIYEPNVAILKGGAFNSICGRFNVSKLHRHTHLYTSNNLLENFPGRKFELLVIEKYSKKDVLNHLSSPQANITTRNFPDSVDQIRKKLGLKEGGEVYLFATTSLEGKPIVLICKKAS